MKKILNTMMLFFLLSMQVNAILPDRDIEKLTSFLTPILDESCKLSKVFKEDLTWSKSKLIELLKKEFSEKEMKKIISFYEEMGGYDYISKNLIVASAFIQTMCSLNVKEEPVNISPEYDALIEGEMTRVNMKSLLASAYELQQKDKLKVSTYRKTEVFVNRAKKYLKVVVSKQFTENEYRKEFDFFNSDLGRRLEKIFNRVIVESNKEIVEEVLQVFKRGLVDFEALKSASSKSDIEKHFHRKFTNKVKDSDTGAYEEVIMLTFFGKNGPIIIGFDDNDKIIYTGDPLHKGKITYRKRGEGISSGAPKHSPS